MFGAESSSEVRGGGVKTESGAQVWPVNMFKHCGAVGKFLVTDGICVQERL